MRQKRRDLDEYIENVLFRNKEDYSYSELKDRIQGSEYLNYIEHGKRLPDEVYRSSLNRLEKEDRIDRHLCTPRSGKRRVCYSLIESRRQEIEIKLTEYFATYILVLFTELYGSPPEYELTSKIIKNFKKWGINLSLNELTEIGKRGITTIYERIQYIQIIKRDHEIAELKKNDMIPRIRIEERYYYRIIGLSVKDLLKERKAIRDRINKSIPPKTGKKASIAEIHNSYPINKTNYEWYLVDEKINENTIKKAIANLRKDNMIFELGIQNGELRYSLQNELYLLLDHCLAIKEDIQLILEQWWKHSYDSGTEAKRWLEFFYPPSQVLAMLKSYEEQRQLTSHNMAIRNNEIETLKGETDFAIEKYNEKIAYVQSKFEKVIKKYHGSLLTNFIQITTNPLVFRSLLKYARKTTSIYHLSLWEQ